MRVSGKVALVTGGGSGIGAATSHRLAEEGTLVVVSDIDLGAAEQVVNDIIAAGFQAEAHHQDVTDSIQWHDIVNGIVDDHGRFDILVNNAGIGIGGSIVDMTLEDWQRQQAINLDGVFLGVKHGIRAMREAGGGAIINLSSVAGLKGAANLAAYNATKGGVRLFTKGVALECARSGWNIRVNSVHPGIIDTPIWGKIDAVPLAEGANTVDIDAMAAFAVPLGRTGTARQIADGVVFLASDEASYITGTELVIDGGMTA